MAGKARDTSKPLHTGVKKSENEYTIHEVLSLLGYDVNDTDRGRERVHDLLKLHHATFIGRCINTVHGPCFFYDKRAMEELKRTEEVNRERRAIEAERKVLNRHLFNQSVMPIGNVKAKENGETNA